MGERKHGWEEEENGEGKKGKKRVDDPLLQYGERKKMDVGKDDGAERKEMEEARDIEGV